MEEQASVCGGLAGSDWAARTNQRETVLWWSPRTQPIARIPIPLYGSGIRQKSLRMADREVVDSDWLAFLKANKVRFGIRLKTTTSVTNKKGKPDSVKKLFQGFPRGCFESIGNLEF